MASTFEPRFRPIRTQFAVISGRNRKAHPERVVNAVKKEAEEYARKEIIPQLQRGYEYAEEGAYTRTYTMYFGWTWNIGRSHNSIALVISNNARDPKKGTVYWHLAQHEEFQTSRHEQAGWNTIQEVMQRDEWKEIMQDALNDALGLE